MAEKIYGLLILPYQYLQIIGYRLSGISCRYEFGVFGVEPLKPTTRSQCLVSKLLPLFILGIGWMMQIGIAVYLARLYQPTLPFVPLFFILLSTPSLALYTHYVRFDLTQKTPLLAQPEGRVNNQIAYFELHEILLKLCYPGQLFLAQGFAAWAGFNSICRVEKNCSALARLMGDL